jgi:hypothetical protein
MDPGVSEEAIFSEVSDLAERGAISEEDAEDFFQYFGWSPQKDLYSMPSDRVGRYRVRNQEMERDL